MKFSLVSYEQRNGTRNYTFEVMSSTNVRHRVRVTAELSLLLKHSIPLQDMPLLCVRALGALNLEEVAPPEVLPFTETDMLLHNVARQAALELAASKRKASRKPDADRVDGEWRGHRPLGADGPAGS